MAGNLMQALNQSASNLEHELQPEELSGGQRVLAGSYSLGHMGNPCTHPLD